MISHSGKSDGKCYVDKLARFAVVTEEFCVVRRNIISCCLIFVFIFILKVTWVSLSSITALTVTGFCH